MTPSRLDERTQTSNSMDAETIETVRALIDFARDYAVDVHGDNEAEYPGSTLMIVTILDAANRAEEYLAS